ncbi:hypothetical protein [Micromonospora sp. NBC_01796]|uniref:hypothetical protein n=1 Tax=Micromonospora sp. NBC_01796 TaxID=2975987 RepID=UPI002DD8BFCF|nr:hypothetical protein [Micromonospora sp. NBC_01796]WSA83448.1 hypothetical protein OIE47_23995 [Micromonospora sp. NBC_01796]
MIVGSLLLILVAVALLVLGLANGSSVLLIASIAASLLAAVALVVGARQAAAIRNGGGDPEEESLPVAGGEGVGEPHPRRAAAGARGNEWRRSDRFDLDDPVTGLDAPVEVLVPHQGGQRHQGGPDPMSTDDPGRRQPAEGAGPWATGRTEAGASDEDPFPDEPAEQYVAPADAARLARMADDVLVVDGRPRYHLADCPHLRDRETEPLPVGEAVELGFTPCAVCEPNTRLLADTRRG